ncbi:3-carboxyethylcatechol 2,3-dioxygenase [Arthrobacter sp. I2-34]|uniref:3-carboxyethylcatechol 2,3-dioxygenase n=1 Tax=Arthrobacter hankyongi TaxID=2904801 RepID=A0ABS9L484_9MICC|nr:3-carboxyethylcatechol 2,3-dioxygenase [Arthrobacter hankyongi]MCG2621426.1 3-carboxyethylcatechol 2,3-dioxygenase [Arthrobacter hankyongi]
MTLAVAAMSHAPSFGNVDPGGGIFDEINTAINDVRTFVEEYAPDVTIALGPDHFNGVMYEMMPPFCVGAQANGVGDWGTAAGPLPVDGEVARELHRIILEDGIDVARSERLQVDHGVLQPLEFIYGHGFTNPIVPIFVNSVGLPLTPMNRVRLFGEAVGRAAGKLDKRVLILASGGLSHNPPIPVWDSAPDEVKERLVHSEMTPEQREVRESTMIENIRKFAEGKATTQPLNAAWDTEILDTFRGGDLTVVDSWTNEWFGREGGSGAHEVRTWIAAFSALATEGSYSLVVDRYWPVETWGAGFGVVAAITDGAA